MIAIPPPHERSVHVDATPEAVWDLVSDVTRTGEWSPVCAECTWDEGAGPRVGAWFTGRNVTPARTWETRSVVTEATRGEVFAWQVGGDLVHWDFTMTPSGGGTLLTEHWELLPGGAAVFEERYGERAADEVEDRRQAAHDGIPVTLATIKQIAEG